MVSLPCKTSVIQFIKKNKLIWKNNHGTFLGKKKTKSQNIYYDLIYICKNYK